MCGGGGLWCEDVAVPSQSLPLYPPPFPPSPLIVGFILYLQHLLTPQPPPHILNKPSIPAAPHPEILALYRCEQHFRSPASPPPSCYLPHSISLLLLSPSSPPYRRSPLPPTIITRPPALALLTLCIILSYHHLFCILLAFKSPCSINKGEGRPVQKFTRPALKYRFDLNSAIFSRASSLIPLPPSPQ